MTKAVTPPDDAQYLICKYGMYYRANAQGYTGSVAEAGRYTLAEAIRHSHPNGPDGPRDGMSYKVAPIVTVEGVTKAVTPNSIVRIRVTSMHESCNRTTFYVELTTDEGFTMTPCGHATGSDYTDGQGLTIEEARDRAVTDAGTWGDFLRITPEPLIMDGVEIMPRVPMDLYTTRRVLAERGQATVD